MDKCIPANPDISGIGVRTAIYAQNILCFAPVIAHLWDGNISREEIKGIKEQSIGMLAIAFAILISSIIEATTKNNGQAFTSFHAAIILDLSWMNNTSTWIWFLLYAHHLTKPDEETKPKREPILASWLAWTDVLLSPVRHLVTEGSKTGPDGTGNAEEDTAGGNHVRSEGMTQRTGATFVRRAWDFVSQAPVLTLGSIHLSLMGGIGLWLWSNPSKFGTPIGNCDPSLTVVGGGVPFSSLGLRIFSLAIYCLLIVPGLNLMLPFLFFLTLHITYNASRHRHPDFWRRLDNLTSTLFRRRRGKSFHVESGTQSADTPSLTYSNTPGHNPATQASNSDKTPAHTTWNHTAFLIVGLGSLVVINIILLVDVELTLLRNKHHQSREDDEWGFGQVLSLLLLVVPVRDFITSILDIREKVEREKVAKEDIQKTFNEHLQHAIVNDTLEGHDFKGLIKQGADPKGKVGLKGALQCVTLLQFAAYQGDEILVEYLIGERVEDDEGGAFLEAARHNQMGTAYLLAKHFADSQERTTRAATLMVAELLKDPDSAVRLAAIECLCGLRAEELLKDSDIDVRQAVIECLSSLGAKGKLQEIRPAIPLVMELLKDSDSEVRRAVIECLSGLGAKEEFQQEIQSVISLVMKLLKTSKPYVRRAAIDCLSGLGAKAEFRQDMRPAIPLAVELLKDSSADVRQAAKEFLSRLGAKAELQQEIGPTIPLVAKLLKDSDSDVRRGAVDRLAELGANEELRHEVRAAIPFVLELLNDGDSEVCRSAIACLSSFGTKVEFQQEIRPAIPRVIKMLEYSNSNVAAGDPSSNFQGGGNCWGIPMGMFVTPQLAGCLVLEHKEIRSAIPGVVEMLEDPDEDVCWAAISCLSSLGAQVEFQEDIQPAIPRVVKMFEYPNRYIQQAAISCLSTLGAQAMLQQEIRPVISRVGKLLVHSDGYIRDAAISCLSSLGAQAGLQQEIRPSILRVIEMLEDSNHNVRDTAIQCLSSLGAQVVFQQEILPAIPGVVKMLEDPDEDVCWAAISCLSSLGAQVEFEQEIRPAIPRVVKMLEDSNRYIQQAAISCLSTLGAQEMLQQEIRPVISRVGKLLVHSDGYVRDAAISCLSSLGAQAELQQEIWPLIPMVIKMLKDSNHNVRDTTIQCLSSLGAQVVFQQDIQSAIPEVVKMLEDPNKHVCWAAIGCLSSLGAQVEFEQDIQAAIPSLLGLLKISDSNVRRAVIKCLFGLRAIRPVVPWKP
ncbi:Multiple ankyrin repeats single kh domain [Mycena venus]|uniref:Vacuolar protein 8 n=1 Tax=Mycena venus TaxID=2733690 RepID=A0A8H6YGI7_9AGAR|nr:Multiple ankyrin repeats single kh domain [Mycena venus]